MLSKKIKNTTIRGNTYWLNMRCQDGVLRQSLKTDSASQAEKIVTILAGKKEEAKAMGQAITKQLIQQFTVQLIKRLESRVTGFSDPFGDEGEELYFLLEDGAVDTAEEEGVPVQEVQACADQRDISLSFVSPDDPDRAARSLVDAIATPTDQGYYQAVHHLTNFFNATHPIRDALEVSDFTKAQTHLDNIKQTFAPEAFTSEITAAQPPQSTTATTPETPTAPTLQQALDLYWSSDEAKGLSERMRDQRQRFFQAWITLIDPQTPVDQISGRMLDTALDIISKIPKARISVEEKLAIAKAGDCEPKNRISAETVRKYKKDLNVLFNWLITKHHIDTNPLSNSRFKIGAAARRGAFSPTQLVKIRDHSASQSDGWGDRYSFITLQMHTGTRQKELIQLTKEDVRQEEGIWFIDINDDGEGKTLKTKASKRRIPVHSYLIQRGFIEYVEQLKDKQPLFSFTTHNLAHTYRQMKQALSLPDSDPEGNALNLYSLRHSFISTLHSAGVSELTVNPLVGHSDRNEIAARYRHIDLVTLQKAVEQYRVGAKEPKSGSRS
ncbi:hypothetical protein BZJ19_11660 [Salinivibrio proteolyticus]|uniref:site-specific integrase n=1 Tax=Salinivibrio proteolyticus TaxID=334715 RepID=UPI0009890183|nr:site-specific integrase [Salinivibrio proteolyticus]OOF24028.1 hypothetical protein BZJ19_11660 [Salinivibrio proteolyticus]